MTSDNLHTYAYDAENHLTQVDGGSTATYAYDANGHRVQKIASGTTTEYLFDLSGNVVAETNGSNILQAAYVYLGGSELAQYEYNLTLFMHKDHLGSTRVMTSLDRTIYDSMDYLPFGEQILGGSTSTHKFTGKERDSESGLDDFAARFYTSNYGRFLSPDDAKYIHPADPQTLNLYTYVANNPLNAVDPTGHAAMHYMRTVDEGQNVGLNETTQAEDENNQVVGDTIADDQQHEQAVEAAAQAARQQQQQQQQQQQVNANFTPQGGTETLGATAGIIAPETLSMTDSKTDSLSDAQSDLAHQRINAERKYGKDVDKYAGEMSPISSGAAYDQALASTIHAAQEDMRGIDPTKGATQYNMRTPRENKAMGNKAPAWAKGMVVHTRSGPFPSWKGPQYILTYGPPLKEATQ